MVFSDIQNEEKMDTFRIMNLKGKVINKTMEPDLSNETLVKMYKHCIIHKHMDKIMHELQRQGRISFYMTSRGEEVLQTGSAAGFHPEDLLFGQYREAGVIFWRGFSVYDMISQCYSNNSDLLKGRNMPVHYGSKEHHFVPMSSCLGTQIPHAVGVAYANKIKNKNLCSGVYFGEGASSEGDAHAAFNFAAVLKCPVIFICRNNGYAISTPTKDQYSGDGLAARAKSYGISTIRVDGNDILAMYAATKQARELAVKKNKPYFIEALAYRLGDHSTSDDSTVYKNAEEQEYWLVQGDPIPRFRKYLQDKGLWDDKTEESFNKEAKKEVLTAFKKADKQLKPNPNFMFTDVYKEMPERLQNQHQDWRKHILENADKYPLANHDQF
ncbi:DgyrCDS5437 [Dimorphilus gyrociliatus]|nr:DgyrCDS5437 [Dimorphilus gyrociliatus]